MATAVGFKTARAVASQKRAVSPIPLLVAALVGVLILPVLLVVVLASLRAGSALPFEAAPLTLQNYVILFADPFTLRLLLNTIIYAGVSLAVGMALCIPLVWLVERTDLPCRSFISAVLFVPLVIPGALTSMGWVLLLSPRAGFLNVGLRELLGMETVGPAANGPLNIYTFAGLVLMTGTGIVPSMFVMLSAAFRNMDTQLEEAGRTSGAGVLTVVRYVTLPIMTPSLAAAAMYYTILLLETFEVPLVIGLNANFRVFSTYVYQLVQSETTAPQYGLAAAFGAMAILVGVVLAGLYSLISRRAYRFVVLRGQRQAGRVIRLGHWRYVAFAGILLYLTLSDLLPILALLWTSLFRTFTPPSLDALQNASLAVYGLVFQDPRWGKAIGNTLVLVISASVASVVLATLVSWVVIRSRIAWLRWLDALAFLPRAIPGVILAVGVFLLYIQTPVYATIWIIVIGHTINYLPYGVRLMSSTLVQLHQELEEAARASGAGTLRTLIEIVFPLMRPAMLNCALWVAAHSVRDFTFALILGATTNTVLSQLLWQTWVRGQWERTSAMAVMLIIVLLVVSLPIRYRISARESI